MKYRSNQTTLIQVAVLCEFAHKKPIHFQLGFSKLIWLKSFLVGDNHTVFSKYILQPWYLCFSWFFYRIDGDNGKVIKKTMKNEMHMY